MTNTNKFLPKELQRIISEQTGSNMMQNLYDRREPFTKQRQIYSFILKNEGYTSLYIASSIHKHHSSVLLSINQANDLITSDKKYKQLYLNIMADLRDVIDVQQSAFLTDYQIQLNEIKTKLENQIINISIVINELKNKK